MYHMSKFASKTMFKLCDFMLVPVANAKHDTNTTIAKGDFASPAGVEIESTEWTWMSLQWLLIISRRMVVLTGEN